MKNIFKNKRNILIMMFALVLIMGIGFAAYSQQLQINDTSSIDSDWNVYIKDIDSNTTNGGATGSGAVDQTTRLKADLTTDLKYPGDYVIYKITVANDGSIDAILEKINFNMEKENTVIKYYYSVDDMATWNEVTKSGENPYNVDLLAKTTDEFQVKVEYDPTKTGTATEDEKSNTLTINFDYVQKTGGGAVEPSEPFLSDLFVANQLKTSAVSTGVGLYKDEIEEGKYIFKGSNPQNIITFNNEPWWILSVDSDGSLKIMRQTSIGNKPWDTSNSNDWTRPATLNTYLNDESDVNSYYYNLSSDAKNLIAEHSWGVGTVSYNNDNLAEHIALEKSKLWSGKVGMTTTSDIIRSNSNVEKCGTFMLNFTNYTQCKSTSYISSTGSIKGYSWTLTPCVSDFNSVYLYNGTLGGTDSANSTGFGVFPVLYLKSDITLSGSGTQEDPYIINS